MSLLVIIGLQVSVLGLKQMLAEKNMLSEYNLQFGEKLRSYWSQKGLSHD